MTTVSKNNPMGTDGFEFLEFCSADPAKMARQLEALGFSAVAKHRSRDITLYRQGDINFLLNNDLQETYVRQFIEKHGSGCCAMGFRIHDGQQALTRAVSLGAVEYTTRADADEWSIPAIEGIDGIVVYLVDHYGDDAVYDKNFTWFDETIRTTKGGGLTYIDHVTHNLRQGNMDKWYAYYQKIFNFDEIRFFNIQGQMTGLVSRAIASPCGKIRIPLNESTDEQSQIEEFIHEFHGEGIQHIALGSDDIYYSVPHLRQAGSVFLDTPDTYFEMVEQRVSGHNEDLAALQKNKILIDGSADPDIGLLLQIFTENVFGPVFFEIIQRKGNQGFGEGNFQALFEAIERDQIRRGVLRPDTM